MKELLMKMIWFYSLFDLFTLAELSFLTSNLQIKKRVIAGSPKGGRGGEGLSFPTVGPGFLNGRDRQSLVVRILLVLLEKTS